MHFVLPVTSMIGYPVVFIEDKAASLLGYVINALVSAVVSCLIWKACAVLTSGSLPIS